MSNKINSVLWYYSIISSVIFIAVVFVLGLITPGYNHLRDTISVLSVMKYGWLQQLNFILLGIGLVTSGYLVYQQFQHKYSQTIWKQIIVFCTSFIVVVVIFPTDPLINAPIFKIQLSAIGIIHLLSLATFFLLAPLGVYLLQKAFRKEPIFSRLSKFTAIMGYTASVMCYIWTFFYLNNWYYAYLGIIQKAIAVIVISWLLVIVYATKENQLKNRATYSHT